MDDNVIFWDREIDREEFKKVLKDESHPRFLEFASLLLSRTNETNTVFNEYIDVVVFCRNWQKIKKIMRKNKWSDKRIVFWDEVYRVTVKNIDKSKLKPRKQKQSAIDKKLKEIGNSIREARKHRGWTQGELAAKTGISQQTISFIERGFVNISFMTLKKIIDKLGLQISVENKKKASSDAHTYTIDLDSP